MNPQQGKERHGEWQPLGWPYTVARIHSVRIDVPPRPDPRCSRGEGRLDDAAADDLPASDGGPVPLPLGTAPHRQLNP